MAYLDVDPPSFLGRSRGRTSARLGKEEGRWQSRAKTTTHATLDQGAGVKDQDTPGFQNHGWARIDQEFHCISGPWSGGLLQNRWLSSNHLKMHRFTLQSGPGAWRRNPAYLRPSRLGKVSVADMADVADVGRGFVSIFEIYLLTQDRKSLYVFQMPQIEDPSPAPTSPFRDASLAITFVHHGTTHTLDFSASATIEDLSDRISSDLTIPESNQKLMITPKVGVLKPPFPATPLSTLRTKKIVLLAPAASELSSIARPVPRISSPNVKPPTPSRHRDWRKAQEEATYTFHTIIPLAYLPRPERSTKFLQRLSDDPGVKAAMRKHKFSVGALTEMNPADHTTHDSRTLGLNRNRGEVIELRLRTDAYDGYRDYKVIRDTLCHELAHNLWGEHDRDFWDLCKDIEKEVRQNDWKSGGQTVSSQIYYDPEDRKGNGEHVDGGGWSGGEFVLGGSGEEAEEGQGVGRREAMAKAAEERMRREKKTREGGGGTST